MVYGYARVSTGGQAKDGNSIEAQEKLLRENGAEMVFTDSFTGTKLERPQLSALLKRLETGDTIIVAKLDRIARSLTGGSALVNELIERGMRVHILNIGMMDNKPASRLIRNIFFSFAEFERDMIVERTREGKAIAKTKAGFKEGRPRKFTPYQLSRGLELLETHSYSQASEMTGISKSTLQRAKNRAAKDGKTCH